MSAASMLRLSLKVLSQDLEPLETCLWQQGALALDLANPEQEDQRLDVLFPMSQSEETKRRVILSLADLGICEETVVWAEVDTGDWRKLRREATSGRRLGRFWLIPEGAAQPESLEEGSHVLRFYANHAFGTGDHATTRLLLQAMQDNALMGKTILDVGCGTGILAIAAEKLGASKSHGFDNDPDCQDDMLRYLALNRSSKTELWIGDIHAVPSYGYDWVFANVTLNVHREFVSRLKDWSHSNTQLLGSGITMDQWDELEMMYREQGWVLSKRATEDPWVCFLGSVP